MRGDKAGEDGTLRRMGGNARHPRRNRLRAGVAPIRVIGEHHLHIDGDMYGVAADRPEPQPGDIPTCCHGCTGMVWAASQLAVTAAPGERTSPVRFWEKASSGTSPSAAVRMR